MRAGARLCLGELSLGGARVWTRWWFWPGLGLGLRVVLALLTEGSSDLFYWRTFASAIRDHGLGATYQNISYFNHPPLVGLYAERALWLSELVGPSFAFWLKLPSILGDTLAGVILWHAAGARAAAIFALCPVAFTISGFHGNTDGLCAALALLSVHLLEQRRPLAAGLALAGAFNVKLIPIFLVPVLAARWRDRGVAGRFAAGLSVGGLPFLALADLAPVLYRNVFAYDSSQHRWGLSWLLSWSGAASDFYHSAGRYVLALGAVELALLAWARARNAYLLGAMTLSGFLVMTPGFGMQYLIYPLAVLLVASPRFGALYAIIGGAWVVVVYASFLGPLWPPRAVFTGPLPAPLLGLAAWLVLGAFVVQGLRARS